MKKVFTLSRAVLLVLSFLTSMQVFCQLNYVTTVPPYNGGNQSALVTFNVKAHVAIRIREMYCSFSASTAQNTIIWYKTDSINGSPTVSTASGWIQASSYSHTPSSSVAGTIVLINDTTLNILIPAGATYGFAISSANVRYSGSGSAPITPSVIGDSNLYINMGTSVGYGGTLTAPIAFRHYNGQIGYQLDFQPTDVAIESMVSPSDTVCSGDQPVQVMIKNNGPNLLQQVQLQWQVNGIPQPPFQWSGSLASNGTALVNVGTYAFLTGTTYSVKVYVSNPNNLPDPVNSNDTILRENIFIKPSPSAIPTSLQVDICQGDTAMLNFNLTGTAPWTLIIKDGTTSIPFTQISSPNFTAKILTPSTRTYIVESVSDATGCMISPAIALNVSVFPAPPSSIATPGGTAACAGDSVVLMASVGLNFSYQWKKDGVNLTGPWTFTFPAKQSGAYSVEVTSPIGCSALSAPVQVYIHPAPLVNLGNDTAMLPGQTVILNAGAGFNSYLWSTGATTQTINASSATVAVINYWVQVTDNNGCKGSDTIQINFTNNIVVSDLKLKREMRFTPNPTDGLIIIHLSGVPCGDIEMEIFSQDGKKVHQEKYNFDSNLQTIQLDLRHLQEGIYLLRVAGNQVAMTRKLVISR
jgi:hypothetical protein